MKYYKAKLSTWCPEITEVEVERETEQSVFINGRREAKESHYTAYFKTYNEAFDKFIQILTQSIARKQYSLKSAEEDLVKFHAKYKRQ